MATLADRRAQAAALARTTRLLYASSAVGLVSLAGVCAVVLSWRMATTQGQWVAFSLLAACSFGWLCTSIITIGYLQDLRRTRLAWFALLALAIVHAGMAAYFEAASLKLRDGFVQRVCYSSDTRPNWDAVESCRGGKKGPVIAFGLVGAILPVASAPLLFLPRGLSRISRTLIPTTPSSTTRSRQAGTLHPPNSRPILPPRNQTKTRDRRVSATVAIRAVRRWSGMSWAGWAEEGASSTRAG
ncbi:RHTO0S04e05248g1_1 [Rhodotorula toruloides]|uniref:RHTO0S04e05248g1_1 n=1 Tax=Rhodotorula toruloides TaxID=5286 RepID=A0A061AXM8_RHOTO|nr:RHTO0S04e05248g1_1 [Rhodotorula toruloides]